MLENQETKGWDDLFDLSPPDTFDWLTLTSMTSPVVAASSRRKSSSRLERFDRSTDEERDSNDGYFDSFRERVLNSISAAAFEAELFDSQAQMDPSTSQNRRSARRRSYLETIPKI